MEDYDWIDMMDKMQDIRLFASLHIKRSKKDGLTSAQEIAVLSKIVLSETPVTPMDLTVLTGMSKSSISRLIEHLTKKHFITKQYSSKDKRSYTLLSTSEGKQELDQTYRYYLAPIYRLRRTLGEERFEAFMLQIKEINQLLQKEGHV